MKRVLVADDLVVNIRAGNFNALCLSGNPLENPADIVNNQLKVGEVHIRCESVGPPTKAQNHQESTVRPAVVKIVEGEVTGRIAVDWRPIFAGGWLNRQPPFEHAPAEFAGIYVVTTRIIPVAFHKVRYLSGLVARWEGKTSRLSSSECEQHGSISGCTYQFRVIEPFFLFEE